MNNETKEFMKGLLLKYNSYQQVVDSDSHLFNNACVVTTVDGQPIELECVDAFCMIKELCEALNIGEDV